MNLPGAHRTLPRAARAKKATQLSARVSSHLVAEAPFLVIGVVQSLGGWRASQDDAVIAIRSWGVFTARPPLLGQFTQATGCAGQTAHAPGPLLYWMLALPVRVDPIHGIVWGAAIWAAIAMVLCVESAWAVRGTTGALAVGVFAVVLVSTQRAAVVNVEWNPYFAMLWFAASCMIAWRVGRGGLRWWPVLVVSASVAAQSHLEFTLPSLVLVVVAPALGIASRRLRRDSGTRGIRWPVWSVTGVGLGAALWAAPLWQEASGHPGNMSLLLHCVSGRHVIGSRFAFHLLAWAVVPPPLWFHTSETVASQLFRDRGSPPAGAGVAVLVVLAAVALVSWRAHRGDLAVLSTLGLLVGGAVVWDLSRQPLSGVLELAYLDSVLWPIGMLVWGVAALGVREVVAYALAEVALRRARGVPPENDAAAPTRAARTYRLWGERCRRRAGTHSWTWAAAVCVAVSGLITTIALGRGTMSSANRAAVGSSTYSAVVIGARVAEHLVPHGPLKIWVSAPSGDEAYSLLFGTIWVLVSEGRQASTPGPFERLIDPPAHAVKGEPQVDITVGPSGKVVGARLAKG